MSASKHTNKAEMENLADSKFLDGTILKQKLSIGESLGDGDVSSSKEQKGPLESTGQIIPHQKSAENVVSPHLGSIPSAVKDVSIPVEPAMVQPTPLAIIEEPNNNEAQPALPVIPEINDQASGKGLLKDISLECSLPHQFSDGLMLHIVQGDSSETLQCTKISPTNWKVNGIVALSNNTSEIMLFIQSGNGGDEAFLTITADEIFAMKCLDGDTAANHAFAFIEEDNVMELQMISTINVSISVKSAVVQPASLTITEESSNNNTQLVSPAFPGINNQESGKGLLKNIFLECSLPHQFSNKLLLHNVQGNSSEVLHCTKISPTTWKVNGIITFDKNTDEILLYIQPWNGIYEAFLIIPAHVISDMMCSEGDTVAKFIFEFIKEDSSTELQMLSTIALVDTRAQAFLKEFTSAHAFQNHYEETKNVDDIVCAIAHYKSSISLCPPDSDKLLGIFNNLGVLYLHYYKHTGNFQDNDHAISHLQNTIKCTPSGDASLPGVLSNLGSAYKQQFAHTGNLQDIAYAISHNQNAVESTPPGDTNLPNRLGNLGNAYLCRFECTGNLQDIDYAIFHHQTAVESTSSGHVNHPMLLGSLGSSYLCRFEYTGNLQDIKHAIVHLQNAIKYTPSGHASLPGVLGNLGTSYRCYFEQTGNLQDIDYAISYHQNAVDSTPSGHISLPSCFSDLGSSYFRRFEHTDNLQDIDNAILYHQNAVESTSSSNAAFPVWLSNLGNSYLTRFRSTGNVQDIYNAISYLHNAANSTPSGHTELPSRFVCLGNSYSTCFNHTRDLQDINHAIFHHQNAVDSTPSDHTSLPDSLYNLGNSYASRFKCTGNLQDIDHSISHLQNAVNSTPPGHAKLPIFLSSLGNSYLQHFEHGHHISDIKNSISLYRRAAAADGIPSTRLHAAKKAARLSAVHDTTCCLIDFSVAIDLLSEMAGLEQTIHRRHANLHGHSDFVGLAVAKALHLGRADLALEWLENSRCLVWNQLNQLRAPIEDLCIQHSSLATQFIQIASALELYGTRSTLFVSSSMATFSEAIHLQNDTRNHTIYATEYKKLLGEIRELPGFHNFLKPPKSTDLLMGVPKDGPIVIFNIHSTQCDALALIAGTEEPLHIPLEIFSLADAEKLQQVLQIDILKQRKVEESDERYMKLHLRIPSTLSHMAPVLRELWCKVVQPILEALAYSIPSTPSSFPRIWWCPTGPLAFLPLHAAGIYSSTCPPGSCVSDFVVSSYTPTVRSINDKCMASSTSSKCTNLLLISQPNTPGLSSIPSTKTETHALKALMEETAHIDAMLVEDAEATTDKVKDKMKSYGWIHFACHGVQDLKNPLKSGVHLHNGRLELLEIMQQKIPNPEFAFLSACQTSKGDVKLSEEAVHLAAGMLAVGYHGVVGTMWSISDAYGPEFAKWFYQYLLDKTGSKVLDSTHAAYALDYATRKVRKSLGQGDVAFLTWVPYVHFGY